MGFNVSQLHLHAAQPSHCCRKSPLRYLSYVACEFAVLVVVTWGYCWPCGRSSDGAGHLFWALIDLGHGLLITRYFIPLADAIELDRITVGVLTDTIILQCSGLVITGASRTAQHRGRPYNG
jgi:hypothetical protein